jgi:glucose/arabinose dehydrogenase
MPFRTAILSIIVAVAIVPGLAMALSDEEIEEKLQSIELPDGFSIALYANDVPKARCLAVGDKGTVFVSTRGDKFVYAIADTDGDSKADTRHIVYTIGDEGDGKERKMPNGVAFHKGDLYIATMTTVFRLDDIESNLSDPPKPVIVAEHYPNQKTHGWKFIAFGPDDKLYVPVGTPCNICDPEEEIQGTISRINADGSGHEIIARGIRNSLGFDWHPETGELWFTENGADQMGDDLPADELNVITENGQHFGNPFVHQGDILDEEFGKEKSVDDFEKPAMKLGPHIAALGMRFYTGDMFPKDYKNQIFIAEHGSGGRQELIGYRVMLVRAEGSKATSYEDFATGWIQSNNAWGRPVDVAVMADGSMLVSDDRAGAVYRISYSE